MKMTLLSQEINPKEIVDNVEKMITLENLTVDKGFYLHIVGKQISFFVYVDRDVKFIEIFDVIKRSGEEMLLNDLEVYIIPSDDSRFVWEREQCLKNKISNFI